MSARAGVSRGVRRLSDREGGGAAGDVRLFANNPGSGWLSENASIPYEAKHDGVLLFSSVSTWTLRNGQSAASIWYSVIYGNGIFVAGGDVGKISTSTDGVNWTDRPTPFGTVAASVVRGLAFGNGVFVAVVGFNIYSSPDAVTWTLRQNVSGGTFSDVCFGGGVFVAVSNGNSVWRSTDGISWGGATVAGASTSAVWSSCTWGNGQFVLLSGNAHCWVSPDGTSWASRLNVFGGSIKTVRFVNGVFVAVGTGGLIYSSSDGSNWTLRRAGSGSQDLLAVTYGNGIYIAAGRTNTADSVVYVSTDLATWTQYLAPAGIAGDFLYSAAYANRVFVVVGGGASGGPKLLTSTPPSSRGLPLQKPAGKEAFTAYTRLP